MPLSRRFHSRQAGFGAFAYILMSIALLASLTAAISISTRSGTNAQQNDILAAKIYGQAAKIRSDVMLCLSDPQVKTSGQGPAAYQVFPACDSAPDTAGTQGTSISNYSADNYCEITGTRISANAKNLTCLSSAAASVWNRAEGNFFPDQVPGFQPWKYVIEANTSPNAGGVAPNGVSIMITSSDLNSSVDIDWVLRKVTSRFGNNEAMVLRRTGSDMAPASFTAAAPVCGTSTGCANTVRIWLAR